MIREVFARLHSLASLVLKVYRVYGVPQPFRKMNADRGCFYCCRRTMASASGHNGTLLGRGLRADLDVL